MMMSLKGLMKFSVMADDGPIGSIRDFDFDDREWRVRKIVSKPRSWRLAGKSVFGTNQVRTADWHGHELHVAASRAQIIHEDVGQEENNLAKNNDPSLIEKLDMLSYFGNIPTMQNLVVSVKQKAADDETENVSNNDRQPANDSESNLLRAGDVFGYRIATNDGKLGVIEDFLVDDETWQIRYLVVDARKEAAGKRILIAPSLIDWVSWKKKLVSVSVDREAVMSCPNFNLMADDLRKQLEPYFDALDCGVFLNRKTA